MLTLLKWTIWSAFLCLALCLSLAIWTVGLAVSVLLFVSLIGIPAGVALLAGTWAVGSAPILIVMSMSPGRKKGGLSKDLDKVLVRRA